MSDERNNPVGRLRRLAQGRGWTWAPGKPIPYGEQYRVSDGANEAAVNYYPKRGKLVLGGAESPLLAALREAGGQAPPAAAKVPTAKVTPSDPSLPGYPHVGMDESGKGDWFGPLVVAAVCPDADTAAALTEKQVRDSKTVAGESLAKLAAEIEAAVPASRRVVRVLLPEEYNRRYDAAGNLNKLLAAVYAEVAAEAVASSGGGVPVVCDQFAQAKDVLNGSFARAGLPAPTQLHRAESASVAVAAASVLATYAFTAAMASLGEQAGLGGPLPKGASDIARLERAVKHILSREGRTGLARYAKTHFRPVQVLLAAAG